MKTDTCKHWRGLHVIGHEPPSCAVGVNVAELGRFQEPGAMYRLPCTSMGGRQGYERAECALAEYPTDEEVAAEALEFEEDFRIKWPVLRDIKANSKPGDSGERECPKCGELLEWFRHPRNGHLRVSCRTPGCFSIME